MVCLIELIPSPWVLEFQYTTLDIWQATKILTAKYIFQTIM